MSASEIGTGAATIIPKDFVGLAGGIGEADTTDGLDCAARTKRVTPNVGSRPRPPSVKVKANLAGRRMDVR